MKQYQEKQAKLVKAMKTARSRIQELNADKEQVKKFMPTLGNIPTLSMCLYIYNNH